MSMEKGYKNKMDIPEKKDKVVSEQSFFFPDYQLSIVATSREEAEEKLQAIVGLNK